jgi:hypothetical protein
MINAGVETANRMQNQIIYIIIRIMPFAAYF